MWERETPLRKVGCFVGGDRPQVLEVVCGFQGLFEVQSLLFQRVLPLLPTFSLLSLTGVSLLFEPLIHFGVFIGGE